MQGRCLSFCTVRTVKTYRAAKQAFSPAILSCALFVAGYAGATNQRLVEIKFVANESGEAKIRGSSGVSLIEDIIKCLGPEL